MKFQVFDALKKNI